MSIVPDNDIWVVANYKETQIAHMHEGQEVDVEVDGLPQYPFKGHIESLAAGTGSIFALLPAENATGNFTKVVQRVPVKIVIDPNQKGANNLRAGLSVLATVATK
jgi:membrane fusion protein (multidrug efflux system)